jgi:hypothetical protein
VSMFLFVKRIQGSVVAEPHLLNAGPDPGKAKDAARELSSFHWRTYVV